MSGDGLSKLGIALTIIFVISLVALFAELFYVLWRRRLRRKNLPPTSNGEFQQPPHSSSDSCFPSAISSKDLRYLFCVRSQSHIEHNSISSTNGNNLSPNAPLETEVIDVWKLQRMCGPPRFLFTIKEEEKEDLESLAEKSLCASAEKESNKSNSTSVTERVTLKECFELVEEPPNTAMVVNEHGGGGGNVVEFSTPCASPMYFTPLTSPIHEEASDRTTEE